MQFFLPGPDADDPEELYSSLARLAGCEPPPPDRRIFAAEFTHNGIEYVARVGERRHAAKPRMSGGRPDHTRPPQQYDDGGVVMAIFAGTPHMLWEVPEDRPTGWANPAMIGIPRSVTYFDPE